jgi:TrmH family RNA methyltransferase
MRVEKNAETIREEFIEKYKGKLKFTGAKHSRIKQVQSIIMNTKSNPRNLMVVEGFWGVQLCLEKNIVIDAVFFSPELFVSDDAYQLAEKMIDQEASYDRCLVSDKVFSRISEYKKPDGLLAVCQIPQYDFKDISPTEKSLYVILDGVEIPGNIGTILRSCDGAGVRGVIVCNRRARLTHPKVLKGSQGAIFTIPVLEKTMNETIRWLEENDITIALTDTDAQDDYYHAAYPSKVALVAGSERYGIMKEWYNHAGMHVKIPMLGTCDSLNVAVSTSIIVYDASMKMKG